MDLTAIPGSRFEQNGTEYLVCSVLNSPSVVVNVPLSIVEKIQKENGVMDLLWPAGGFVYFRPEGMIVGAFGRASTGGTAIGRVLITFEGPDPGVSEEITELWQKLRETPQEALQKTLHDLVMRSVPNAESSEDSSPELLAESIAWFEAEHVRVTAEVFKVDPSRVKVSVEILSDGGLGVQLFVDGKAVPEDSRESIAIFSHFKRILSANAPN